MTSSTTNLTLPATAAIDLQTHTILSDGSWEPDALINYLKAEQFDLVAITDHDRPDTMSVLQQLALEKQFPLLAAAEMTALWHGKITDLLCYGFDSEPNALQQLAQDVWHRQQANTREVIENIRRKGIPLPEDPDTFSAVLEAPSARQPHELTALLSHHGVSAAANLVWSSGCRFMATPLPDVVAAAHESGAVCLIAHPGRADGFVTYDADLLDQVRREVPIDGLEVYYPRHTAAQTALYLAYAQRHQLLISSGSDSHGPDNLPIKYPAELSRTLLERVGINLVS